MRSNELHCSAKQVQRSHGRSSVAAAAYRAGERIRDERTGLVHNYTRKSGVEHSRIYAPANAPEWATDRAQLWNEVERKENRGNSITAREIEIAFPCEFNKMQRMEAGDGLASELVGRYNCVVDINYHEPSSDGDERNYHAHILFTTRGIDNSTDDGWEKNKYRNLNKDIILVNGQKTLRSSHEIDQLRQFSAKAINRIADRDNLEVITEHESYRKRGIDKDPQIKLGPSASAMERKGIHTDRGDINREIQARNAEREAVQKERETLELTYANKDRGLKKEAAKLDREHDESILERTFHKPWMKEGEKDPLHDMLLEDMENISELKKAYDRILAEKEEKQEPEPERKRGWFTYRDRVDGDDDGWTR